MYGVMYGYVSGETTHYHTQEELKMAAEEHFPIIFESMLEFCEQATLLDEDSTFKDLVARYREAFEGRDNG